MSGMSRARVHAFLREEEVALFFLLMSQSLPFSALLKRETTKIHVPLERHNTCLHVFFLLLSVT